MTKANLFPHGVPYLLAGVTDWDALRKPTAEPAPRASLSRIALTGTLHSSSATARGGSHRGRPASPFTASNRPLWRLFLAAAALGAATGFALACALNAGLL